MKLWIARNDGGTLELHQRKPSISKVTGKPVWVNGGFVGFIFNDIFPEETFPKGIWDMRIKFDVLDKIKELNPQYILIVSNQGGIESGFVDEHNFRSKYEYITRAIKEYCGCECYSMYCKTNDKTDLYRKPNVGMLYNLLDSYVGDDFDHIKSKSLMIGLNKDFNNAYLFKTKKGAEQRKKLPCYSKCTIKEVELKLI